MELAGGDVYTHPIPVHPCPPKSVSWTWLEKGIPYFDCGNLFVGMEIAREGDWIGIGFTNFLCKLPGKE